MCVFIACACNCPVKERRAQDIWNIGRTQSQRAHYKMTFVSGSNGIDSLASCYFVVTISDHLVSKGSRSPERTCSCPCIRRHFVDCFAGMMPLDSPDWHAQAEANEARAPFVSLGYESTAMDVVFVGALSRLG